MGSASEKPRIRQAKDWVERCRAWIWLAGVLLRGDKSDDALDALFIPGAKDRKRENGKDERLRTFARIRRLGHSPGIKHSKLDRGTLVELVDQKEGYQGTRQYYDTKLWELLGPTDLDLREINDLIVEFEKKRNLYRASRDEASTGRRLFPSAIEFSAGAEPTREYLASLKSMSSSGSLDDLGLLCAMYRQAVFTFNIPAAAVLTKEIRFGVANVIAELSLADDALLLFDALVERRVLGNNRSAQATKSAVESVRRRYPKKSPERSSALFERRIQIHALLVDSGEEDHHFRPHVPVDAKLQKRLDKVRRENKAKPMRSLVRQFQHDWFYPIDPAMVESVKTRFSPVDRTNAKKLAEIDKKVKKPARRSGTKA